MGQENSLWLGNHRYEVDWLLGWVFTQRLGLAGVRYSLKMIFFCIRIFLFRVRKFSVNNHFALYQSLVGVGITPNPYFSAVFGVLIKQFSNAMCEDLFMIIQKIIILLYVLFRSNDCQCIFLID
jgi:hypothetical protein